MAPLSPDAAKPVAGEVRADGLVYSVNPDGASVSLVGWRGAAPTGDVSVPAEVCSGEDSFAVTRIGVPGADGKSAGVLAGSSAASISIPASVDEIVDGALSDCPTLERVEVSSKNETYSSFDGALYSKDLTSLLFFPEGRQGAAHIPDRTATVPASALSHSPGLQAVLVGEASASFASRNGMLYSLDMKTLVACPPGAAGAVVVPEGVESIAAGAFAGCEVASIMVLGDVREVAADAFDEAARSAVVALPAGEDYDVRKAVWAAAGFSEFAEPAKPGDATAPTKPEGEGVEGEGVEGSEGQPGAEASGLAYTLLDDYTLSVAWTGPEDPAADLDIPATAELNGVSYRVSAVAPSAFEGRSSLRSVKLPASVTSVGDSAFANCANLADAQLPEGLRAIGASAFESTALADVWLPASLASVGSRALAACGSLTRVVALGSPEVATDALAECSGVTVYFPAEAAGSWNVGLPAAGNHLAPYGIVLSETPLNLEVGQTASLFDGDDLQAPDSVETTYAYSAKPVSVDQDGLVTAKAEGTSDISVTLALDNKELARATRTIEVAPAPEQEVPDTADASDPSAVEDPAVDLASASAPAVQFAQTFSLASEALSAADLQPISETALLATGDVFEQRVASGQTLKFAVLADDGSGIPKVSVAQSDDPTLKPTGELLVPRTVEKDGVEYEISSVVYVGFRECLGLTSVVFADDSAVTSIASSSFSNCRTLAFVRLPNSLESMGTIVFDNCSSLGSLEIPDSVRTLGGDTLSHTVALTSVTFGTGVTRMPSMFFKNCTALRSINVKGELATFDSYPFTDGTPTELVDVTVPNEATRQAWVDMAASEGISFKSITVAAQGLCTVSFDTQGGLPASFTRTVAKESLLAEPGTPVKEGYSFTGWVDSSGARWDFSTPVNNDTALRAEWAQEVTDGQFVYSLRSDGRSLAVRAADPASLRGHVDIPASFVFAGIDRPVEELADLAFYGAENLVSVSIPSSVTRIGMGAFWMCARLAAVDLPSSLSYLGASAFRGCASLEKVVVPSSLTFLEPSTFVDCTKLTAVELPSSLKALGNYTFLRCTSLVSIVIPASVACIPSGLFDSCTSLSDVRIEGDIIRVDEVAFSRCSALESVTGLDTVEIVGYGAFALTKLRAVNLPAAKKISTRAFSECTSLESVALSQVESIGDYAFIWCSSLVDINLPSSLSSLGKGAFINCDALASVFSDGSAAAPVVAAGFSTDQKANVTVVLPGVASDGSSESYAQMAATWRANGFSNVACSEGALPTADDPGNTDPTKAGWSLDADGTLNIFGTDPIAGFAWFNEQNGESLPLASEEHWGPVRYLVKRVSMQAGLRTTSMDAWFAKMPQLADLSGVYIPEGVGTVRALFERCSGIESLPEGFVIPDTVTSTRGMFHYCTSLRGLPDVFSLPTNLVQPRGMFRYCESLTSLPESLELPATVKDAASMLEYTALTHLPEGFLLPEGIEDVGWMLSNCYDLMSLPEGFKLPSTVTNYAGVFASNFSLMALPSSFSMPKLADPAKMQYAFNVVPFATGATTAARDLFYPGDDPVVLGMEAAWWSDQGRTLVTPQDAAVICKVSDGSSPWVQSSGARLDQDGLMEEPSAPYRPGKVFTLWYADEGCTVPVDFGKRIDGQATTVDGSYVVYGKYADGVACGGLRTVGNAGTAWWSLTADGGLYVRGDGVISNFLWNNLKDLDKIETEHWGPYRDRITSVHMSPSVNVSLGMGYWFYNCTSLVDVSGFFVPKSAGSLGGTFFRCSSLATLPEDFVIPDWVTYAGSCFAETGLRSLPASFRLPSAKPLDCTNMFAGCENLSLLPEGFSLDLAVSSDQAKTSDITGMFANCPNLTALPASFDFSADAKIRRPVFSVEVGNGQPRVPTYYSGSSSVVLGYDWEGDNRTLVADAADAEGFGMQRATFKVKSATPDANGAYPWETRSVAWSDKQGILANPGDPQLASYTFTGWCADEDCLVPFDFSKPLPEGGATLYGSWVVAGAKNAADRAGGELPCVDSAGNPVASTAWWRIVADGTLLIGGEGSVGSLGFTWSGNNSPRDYWEPYRDRVKSIRMDRDLKAPSLHAWFCRMPNLVDASGMFVPEGCVDASDVFYNCRSLATLPVDLRLPESVGLATSFFEGCGSIVALPDTFLLPAESKKSLNMASMFRGCSKLVSLPAGFTIPERSRLLNNMFENCASLASLPEGFSVPAKAESMNRMFSACNSLTILPASFEFPLALAEAAENPFLATADLVETYFAGGADSTSSVNSYSKWQSQNRTITTSLPSGKATVNFMVPDKTTGEHKLWTRQLAGVGEGVAEPAVPTREGFVFAGWFTEAGLENEYDFATGTVPADGLTLYASYAATSGDLPTTDGARNATWELAADGTLTIACQNGATIKSLGWDPNNISATTEGTWDDRYWGFVRDEVERIEMAPGVKAEDMDCWFAEMHNLVDASGVYVPEGVKRIKRLFFRCSSLKSLPEGFSIPEGVVEASDMFGYCSSLKALPSGFSLPATMANVNFMFDSCASLQGLPASFGLPEGLQRAAKMFIACANLRSLPAGFAVPDTVVTANSMFAGCSSLEALPAKFKLSSKAADVSEMFRECSSLKLLPEGFSLPSGVTNAARMFRGCSSLKGLPESFAVPGSVGDVSDMFRNCPSLTWLPASFDLAGLVGVSGVGTMFSLSVGFVPEGGLLTYYAGDDLAKLSVGGTDAASYWLSSYGRSLQLASGKPESTKAISFFVADPVTGESKAWMTIAAENGAVDRPAEPALFGYAFDGWYTDPAFSTGSKFAFGKDGTAVVSGDTALYGRYVLMLDVDIPLAAKVDIDASGTVTAGEFDVVSNTPKKLVFTQVASATTGGTSLLVPNAADHAKVKLDLRLGDRSVALPIAGGSSDYVASVPAATPGAPSTLAGSIGLALNGAQIDFQPGEDITSLAKLTWTVEAVS